MIMYYSTESGEWFLDENKAKKAENQNHEDNKDDEKLESLFNDFDKQRKQYMKDKKALQDKYEGKMKKDINDISELLYTTTS